MVELRLDESSGIYAAPLQMKANNGIFIIDDFGLGNRCRRAIC